MAYKPADHNGRTFKERFPERTRARGGHRGYWTDSHLFKEVVTPLIEREGRSVDGDEWGDNEGSGLRVVAARAAGVLGITFDALARRIYDVMYDRSDSLKIETAEAIIIATGENFCVEPIPTFPGTPESAWDMAEAWAEPGEDIDALAHRLIRFALGWQAADEVIDREAWLARVDERNAGVRARRERRAAKEAAELKTYLSAA
jgi:hypothetical protein